MSEIVNNENVVAEDLSEQMVIRREKLKALQEAGNNPFEITKYDVTHTSREAVELFASKEATLSEGEEISVKVAGRMMSRRIMGKASFAHLLDEDGQVQLYVSKNDLGEENYDAFKKAWDIGDIIGVEGVLFRTRTGEISIHAKNAILLSKSLHPLPEKYHGLTNLEQRYRQRYVDLIVNPEVKDTFVKRSQILKEIRNYLDNKGFLEVDTPILVPMEIGASAKPFVTYHTTNNKSL